MVNCRKRHKHYFITQKQKSLSTNNEEETVWSLIEKNLFHEAINLADEEYKPNNNNDFILRNKVIALLNLKKYNECFLLCKKIIEISNGETDSDFIRAGICQWLLGNEIAAINLWKEGENSQFKDAAGGLDNIIYLYYGGVKTNDDNLMKSSIKKIKRIVKNKSSINWPGILGFYLLDKMDEELIYSKISDVPVLKERELCQAHFTIAIKKLEQGQNELYYSKLKDAISYGSASYLADMYYMAKGELDRKNIIY